MLWNKARRSENVNDQRKDKDVRSPTGIALAAGLIVSIMAGMGAYWADLEKSGDIETVNTMQEQPLGEMGKFVKDDPHRFFVESVLGSTEDVWTQIFAQVGKQYQSPELVLYDVETQSACGAYRSKEAGPFYCELDKKIYIDLKSLESFTVQDSMVADFAQAYVIAHEVGHHVQNEMGVLKQMEDAENSGESMTGADGLGVRLELQADCLAGYWARHAQENLQWLDPDDLDEALEIASKVGDDYLMRKAHLEVRPEAFTHGTSQQRINWFNTGFNASHGDACTTFEAAQL
ncbi:neutral zinc metallopeptidase [Pseudomonas sp. Irchel 3E19]|uniref:KPN_02809 family neutral zinc metallopeptidase n=1 Tax=Pseudomonas sp. Irchel 3E19 TaxID=2008981 RepID=UPI000BA4D326|nr:neutral zinc metallopeptidase [Pseudomonas sp. Irchel 3E19]